MLILVNQHNQDDYINELASMHHLRKRVFKDQLGWDVSITNGMEFDQFDTDDAHYLMHVNTSGVVDGCTRLISTVHPYLLGDVFSELVGDYGVPKNDDIWETTRFCSDHSSAPKNIMGILAAGMLEFAISKGISEYVSVSDIRIETLIKRYGWCPQRLGKVINTGTDMAAGERFVVTSDAYEKVCSKCEISNSIIHNLHEICNPYELQKVA
jgi:N-acyl-L-homoserine lactone synthetase